MWKKTKFLDPTIIIGVVISLAVSIILVLIGQDGVTSLMVGSIITTITLIIDVATRISESEKKVLDVSILNREVVDDPFLLSMISQIIEDHKKVKKLGDEFFASRANNALLECRDMLHGLAEGEMLVDQEKALFTYGEKASKTVKAVTCYDPTVWRTKYGESLIKANEKAITRGVKFTHVWIQKDEVLTAYRDILFKMQETGVEVRVTVPDGIPRHLRDHYRIVDDKKVIKLEVAVDGQRRAQRISIDPMIVERAARDFDRLLPHTRSLEEYFEGKNAQKHGE